MHCTSFKMFYVALSIQCFMWHCLYNVLSGIVYTMFYVALSIQCFMWHCLYNVLCGIVYTKLHVALSIQGFMWHCLYNALCGIVYTMCCIYSFRNFGSRITDLALVTGCMYISHHLSYHHIVVK